MTTEWQASCKDCGAAFGYSHSSYVAGTARGFSRPERCPDCRKRHAREIQTVGMPFFKVRPLHPASVVTGVEAGVLGKIEHPPREHVATDRPSTLDTSKFGITEAKLYELFDKMQRYQVVVVVGPTGSGKSTYLPYRLMVPPTGIDPHLFTRYGQILVTQPRIQAARNIPAYVAKVMHGSSIGAGFDVGFRHSNTPASDWRCKLVYVTDGTLINWIVTGQIGNLSVIMIDEAHERSLNIDLILGLLKKLLPRYPRLKLVVASATIDHEKFIRYFGGEDHVGYVEFEGKSYGVTEHYRDDLGKSDLPYDPAAVSQLARTIHKDVSEQVVDLLRRMYVPDGDLQNKRGDILAFLHGVKPIEEAVRLVQEEVETVPELAALVDVLPLYTTLPQEKQDQALGKPQWMKELEARQGYADLSAAEQEAAIREAMARSRRRVVISTNVAETSLTVHGILHVVDCGLINQDGWDPVVQTKVVMPVLHSRAGCRQRWGRAGRLMAGDAYCLYTRNQFNEVFPGYSLPQIMRSPLDQIVLTAKAAGIDDLERFPWIDQPSSAELQRSATNLMKKQALDPEGDLTNHGLELQSFAEEPNLANLMVLADRFGCVVEMATLIPMMKLGGFSRILKRERSWDAMTRRAVRRIHRALLQPCADDIELCLKLYAAWSEARDDQHLGDTWAFKQIWQQYLPPLTHTVKEQLGAATAKALTQAAIRVNTPAELDEMIADINVIPSVLEDWRAQVSAAFAKARPAAWARLYFAHYRILKARIEADREQLIDALSGHKKEDERRPIDFDLLTRLRMIFAYALPERTYVIGTETTSDGNRVYQPAGQVESQPPLPAVIGAHSICYGQEIPAFVCSKQQAVAQRLASGDAPTQVMMVSFLTRIEPEWIMQIAGCSPLALAQIIARSARVEAGGDLPASGAAARLMVDQRYPPGTRYQCRLLEPHAGLGIAVELLQRVAGPPAIVEIFRSGDAALPDDLADADMGSELLVNTALDADDVIVTDPEEDVEPGWVNLADDGREIADDEQVCVSCGTLNRVTSAYCRTCGSGLALPATNAPASNDFPRGWLISDQPVPDVPRLLLAEVVGYDLSTAHDPSPILKPVETPEPFARFVSMFAVKDVITVTVVEHDTYPGDPLVALVVKERTSGFETLLEPADVSFATRSFLVRAIKVGTELQAVVEDINPMTHRVRLACHGFLDGYIARLLGGVWETVVRATIGDVTDEGVFFILDWADPSRGLLLGAFTSARDLPQSPHSYTVGVHVIVRVRASKRAKFRTLQELPAPVEAILEQRRWKQRLEWNADRKTLNFTGLMTYAERQELKQLDDDEDYRRVIDDLYRFSNQFEADMVRPYAAVSFIPRNMIGKLIGVRGATINGLRKETGATIFVTNERSEVTVEADTPEQLEQAIEQVRATLETLLSFQAREMPQPRSVDDPSPATVDPLPPSVPLQRMTMTVPRTRVGKLIGKGGETIHRLGERTGTRIRVDGETGIVTVEGADDAHLQAAERLIQETVAVYDALLQITPDQIGIVIGKGGTTIRGLKADTRTQIAVDQGMATIHIEGDTGEQVEQAIQRVFSLLTTYQATGTLSPPQIGRLLGNNRALLEEIRTATRTWINVDTRNGIMLIKGSSQAGVTDARDRVCLTLGMPQLNMPVTAVGSPTVVSRSYTI